MSEADRGGSRSRSLSPAEIELWTAVTADVRPASGRSSTVRQRRELGVSTPEPKTSLASGAGRTKAEKPPRRSMVLDHRIQAKLRRGALEVEAALDLHGLRQAEAQRALVDFLRRAQAEGARMAIVVTGKGRGSEHGGVLRRLVPIWLQAPNLRDLVVGFGEASRGHGGEGALYVQIRRAGRGRKGG